MKTAVRGKLPHHLLVQPDIHAGGIIGIAGVAEFPGKLLARSKAGVDIERLHQIDNRGAPLQFFFLGRGRLVQDRSDIDGLSRCGRRAASRRSRSGSRTRASAAACRGCIRLGAEDRAHDFSENTHGFLQ
jgi:hypothetical protein